MINASNKTPSQIQDPNNFKPFKAKSITSQVLRNQTNQRATENGTQSTQTRTITQNKSAEKAFLDKITGTLFRDLVIFIHNSLTTHNKGITLLNNQIIKGKFSLVTAAETMVNLLENTEIGAINLKGSGHKNENELIIKLKNFMTKYNTEEKNTYSYQEIIDQYALTSVLNSLQITTSCTNKEIQKKFNEKLIGSHKEYFDFAYKCDGTNNSTIFQPDGVNIIINHTTSSTSYSFDILDHPNYIQRTKETYPLKTTIYLNNSTDETIKKHQQCFINFCNDFKIVTTSGITLEILENAINSINETREELNSAFSTAPAKETEKNSTAHNALIYKNTLDSLKKSQHKDIKISSLLEAAKANNLAKITEINENEIVNYNIHEILENMTKKFQIDLEKIIKIFIITILSSVPNHRRTINNQLEKLSMKEQYKFISETIQAAIDTIKNEILNSKQNDVSPDTVNNYLNNLNISENNDIPNKSLHNDIENTEYVNNAINKYKETINSLIKDTISIQFENHINQTTGYSIDSTVEDKNPLLP